MKININFFSTLLFLIATLNLMFSQTQVGTDIDGEAAFDFSGGSISLSSDGSRIAIGAFANNGNGSFSGHVRVYDWSGGAWAQSGEDIDGEAADDNFGISVSLSSDGNRLAIGARYNNGNGSVAGHVRIYEWNAGSWIQIGEDIDGEAEGDNSGVSVSLSSDGSRVAIGAYLNDGNGSLSGHVRVYDWSDSNWIQVGEDIDGEAAGDLSGRSVSLSSDGSRLAIGANANDGNGSVSGHVRVYEWNGVIWTQLGEDIDGEAAGDSSGNSVSLSSDGIRLAVGADRNGFGSGYVRVYEWNGAIWVQMGEDIDGEAEGDSSGNSVSLSSDGSRLAIGAPTNAGNGVNAGHVRVYEWIGGSWAQIGADIDGEAEGDYAGSVTFSSDGNRVAIGAPFNDGNGVDAGHVRVYEFEPVSIITLDEQDIIEVYPNPTRGKIRLIGIEYKPLRIIDNLGRLQWEIENPTSEIDISKLSNGIYFLLIISDNQLMAKKIIKE